MFNTFAHTAVDAVQTSKKAFIEAFIEHEGIAKVLNSFVDSQTAYTKAALDAGITTATSLGTIFSSKNFYNEIIASAKSFMLNTSIKGK